jgi:hypothetical protein
MNHGVKIDAMAVVKIAVMIINDQRGMLHRLILARGLEAAVALLQDLMRLRLEDLVAHNVVPRRVQLCIAVVARE